MIRTLFRMAAVSAVLSLSTVAAHSQTTSTGKPLTDADAAEGQALVEDYVLPIMKATRAALAIATTDAPGACRMAKANEEKALVLRTKVKTMQDRLTAEGKTTEGFDDINTGSQQMVEGAHSTASALCSSFLPKTGNPEHDAMVDKMIGISARLHIAMLDAAEAEANGDHAGACVHMRQGKAAFSDLVAYVRDLRTKIRNGTPDAAQADAAIAKAAIIGDELDQEMRDCPAV